jgi:hypothetical protein
MSVVLVVKVSEGLVLGADSAATISGKVNTPTISQTGILKTYFNSRKLLQIGDFPLGILTWGSAFIGSRTIESLVREWEYDNHWQSRDELENAMQCPDYDVRDCAEGLRQHIEAAYKAEYDAFEPEKKPSIGLVVAGYSHRQFFPSMWQISFPRDNGDAIQELRQDIDGRPDFGANWFGLTDAIVRLHFGRDDRVLHFFSNKYGTPIEELAQELGGLQYVVPFAVMPLQDAIDYAYYMLNVAVGRYRFVIGPELCGGQIEIAAITQRQLQWISRKTWSLDGGRR